MKQSIVTASLILLGLIGACARSVSRPVTPVTPVTSVTPVTPVSSGTPETSGASDQPSTTVGPKEKESAQRASKTEGRPGTSSLRKGTDADPSSSRQTKRSISSVAIPESLRVGLATDLSSVTLPCCGSDLMISAAGKKVAALASARVEPASPGKSLGSYRVQVAALKDEGQAKGVAQRITLSTGEESDVVFDAKSDLYRVRVGRYASREEAAEKRAAVVATGLKSSWVVFEQKPAASPALKIIRGSDALIVPGQWLQISTTGHEGIQVLNGRYRGRILIYLNRRGRLNVINEIGFEDYLRGVIPREMGPNVYDNLDALKAQTIAARSYTVHNLGEFGGEGYDICSTPRCQVYGGMNAEHPLSDQAIAETAGEILAFDGEPVDALYSSTCGGHTEDVSVIFPKKNEAYLKGVPCLEAGVDRLSGGLAQGSPFPAGLTRRLIPAVEGSSASARLAARLEKVARLAGLPLPTDRLRSLDRREVQRFVASVFDLVLDSRLFVAPEDLPYLLDKPPSGWSQADLQLAAYLVKSGLLAGPLDQPLSESEIEETLFELALFLRVIEKRDVRYLGSEGEKLRVRFKGEEEILPIPEQLTTYRRTRGGYYSSSLALLPGDRMTIFLVREQIIGVLHDVDSDGVAYDRTSNFSSWTRFRTDRQLRDLVDQRYPGLGFRGLSIVARGKSGRVAKMRLEGENGRKQLVEGLPVRWTLDVPDTWFTAKRLAPAGREPGWLFTGRGWGHGVGMCQVGAYGMGVRGHGYRDILQHYYTGVELVVGKPEPRRR